ncbi:MAG TPA: calcium/proton exchanger [Ktedonobacteraceae bacterium]|nr:calcium/proton exchanger [Ktedonobacteraceae bacterium]
MPRWLYSLVILAVVAPIISLIGGPKLETAIFIFSTLSLIPLAALIGRATEDLTYYVGPITGGLLNATFGNAPEVIIGIFALQQGLLSVVKASITGSIISNALLVLGGSLALGGFRWGKQFFSYRDAGQYSAMMVMAVAGLLIPYIASTAIHDKARMQAVSVGIALILLVVYVLYLGLNIFHIRSVRRNPSHRGKSAMATRVLPTWEEDSEDEVPAISGGVGPQEVEENVSPSPPAVWLIVTMLLIATIGTAWNSELLVGALVPVATQLGWSPIFIGLVILPIVGNAAEHSSSMIVAYKDRVDLSMAIAAGSSIQVATFVAPLLVLVSLFFHTQLDLVFQPLELIVLSLATILFAVVSWYGESTWLAGMQLIAVYVMACVVFFLLPR